MALGDYVGSTTGILKYCRESDFKDDIAATEEGVRYMLEKESPEKRFHFASRLMFCPYMKVHHLKTCTFGEGDRLDVGTIDC